MERGSPATDQAPMYVSARFFYSLAPASPSAPAAMTRRRAESILAKKDAVLDIDVKATPFPLHSCSIEQEQPYARTRALVRSAEWTTRTPTKDVPADGELLLSWRFPNESSFSSWSTDATRTSRLRRHCKPIQCTGSQNWGGLTIGIGCQGAPLYRFDVDVF